MGNITHDGYAFALGIGVQGAPLAVELVLDKRPEADLLGVFGFKSSQGGRVAQAQGLRATAANPPCRCPA